MWIELQSGSKFNFSEIENNKILLSDIATALSKICRYGGHCKQFYSVAEHSVMCSRLAGDSYVARMLCLLHDATEAYIGDIVRPLKQMLPEYINLEKRLEKHIHSTFCIAPSAEQFELCKQADNFVLLWEAKSLTKSGGLDWTVDRNFKRLDFGRWDEGSRPHCLSPDKAERAFKNEFNRIEMQLW